jgi:hypothetical protein
MHRSVWSVVGLFVVPHSYTLGFGPGLQEGEAIVCGSRIRFRPRAAGQVRGSEPTERYPSDSVSGLRYTLSTDDVDSGMLAVFYVDEIEADS